MSKKLGMRFTPYRTWGCVTGTCVLCETETRCFEFEDNEGYSTEKLCMDCLHDMIQILTEDTP